MAKVKNNAQPSSAKDESKKLYARIAEYGKNVRSVRDEGQTLLYDACFFALGVGSGNLQPLAKIIQVSQGMAAKDMVKWCEDKFGCVKRFKDKDTGAEGFKATENFKDHVAEFKKDKLAYAKKLRAEKKFWELDKSSPFDGMDLIKLLIAAANKTEKASNDPTKAPLVKHADLLPKVREFIKSISPKDEDDSGEPEEDDVENTIIVGKKAAAEGTATIQ